MEHVDNDKVVCALNYHGQQLTSFLKDQPIFRQLDLKKVDYHLYQKRSRELRLEDRGRRLLLHKFISQNVESLFRMQETSSTSSNAGSVSCSDDFLPPIEAFMSKHLSKDARIRNFFDLSQEGDILYCSVASKNQSGLLLSVLCFAPESGKVRSLFDLGVKCFCPSVEVVPAEDGRSYEQESITLGK